MKKLFIIVISVLLLFCGCTGEKTAAVITSGITFTAEVKSGKRDFSFNGEIADDGTLLATFTAPAAIKGLQVTSDGKTAAFEFMGLKYEKDLKDFQLSGVVNVILSAVNDRKNTTAETENGKFVKSGKAGGYGYEFTFSEDGLPLALKVAGLETEIIFKNVQTKTG